MKGKGKGKAKAITNNDFGNENDISSSEGSNNTFSIISSIGSKTAVYDNDDYKFSLIMKHIEALEVHDISNNDNDTSEDDLKSSKYVKSSHITST